MAAFKKLQFVSFFCPSLYYSISIKINCFDLMELTELLSLLTNSIVNPSAINTIRVGRTDDPTTPITITPSLSQPVKLECERTSIAKDWYTYGTKVTPTTGDLTTRAGVIRTLFISSFSPSYAKGYTCIVTSSSLSATTLSTYPVILGELYNNYSS